MKKNKMMRLASVLLVLVMLTTSVIGGTFAKYTTQDSASDMARVAKWGVELQVVGNLYGDAYTTTGDITAGDSVTVKSSTASTVTGLLDDVVAPGTKNNVGMSFSLQGTPEVSGKVSATIEYETVYLKTGEYGVVVQVPTGTITADNYNEFYVAGSNELWTRCDGVYSLAAATFDNTATYFTLEDNVNLTTDYYPVEYAMVGTGTEETSYNENFTGALTIDTLGGLCSVIGSYFGEDKKDNTPTDTGRTSITYSGTTFDPNQDLQKIVKLGNQKITWKWDFCQEKNKCVDGNAACDACKADTILGNLMAKDESREVVKITSSTATAPAELTDYNLESYFSLDITVTQAD